MNRFFMHWSLLFSCSARNSMLLRRNCIRYALPPNCRLPYTRSNNLLRHHSTGTFTRRPALQTKPTPTETNTPSRQHITPDRHSRTDFDAKPAVNRHSYSRTPDGYSDAFC